MIRRRTKKLKQQLSLSPMKTKVGSTRAPHGQREPELSETDSAAVGFRVVSVHFSSYTYNVIGELRMKKNKETKKKTATLPNEKTWEDCFEKRPNSLPDIF